VIEKYPTADPVNLGTDEEVTIDTLAHMIIKLIGSHAKVVFDTSKPDGSPRRNCDNKKAKEQVGFHAMTKLEDGLKKTIEWYKESLL
jgi:GDP-L-fucose synthase